MDPISLILEGYKVSDVLDAVMGQDKPEEKADTKSASSVVSKAKGLRKLAQSNKKATAAVLVGTLAADDYLKKRQAKKKARKKKEQDDGKD